MAAGITIVKPAHRQNTGDTVSEKDIEQEVHLCVSLSAVSVGWMDLVPLQGEIDFVSTVMIFIDFTQRSLGGWSSKISSDEGWG